MLVFLLLLIVGLLLVVFGFIGESKYRYTELFSFFNVAGIIFGILILLINFAALPVVYIDSISFVEQFNETKRTIKVARENETLENAALVQSIIEKNNQLKLYKFWSEHGCDIYISDKIDSLNYLK